MIFCYHKSQGYFWFRFFGYGLHIKDSKVTPMLFSERYGHTKRIRVGRWVVKVLKP